MTFIGNGEAIFIGHEERKEAILWKNEQRERILYTVEYLLQLLNLGLNAVKTISNIF